MIFINTRPAERANALSEHLRQQGVTVVDLPLLALMACELIQIDKQKLSNIHDYQAIVFVSETAVQYFVDFLINNQINLPNIPIIAVGEKTATYGEKLWRNTFAIMPNIITPSQFGLPENNEGMLQLPIVKNLQKNDKILICKGKNGRDLLKIQLQKQGVIVQMVDFYQRIFPKDSEILFKKFYQNWQQSKPQTIVLISSLTAWQCWQDLLNKFNSLPNDFAYLVLQQRIANHLTAQNIQNICVIDDLRLTTITDCINKMVN